MRRLWSTDWHLKQAVVVPHLRNVLSMRMPNGNASDAIKFSCNVCMCCNDKYGDVSKSL